MAIYLNHSLYIESELDLEQELCRYNCVTEEELSELLRTKYNIVLIINYKHERRFKLPKRDRGI